MKRPKLTWSDIKRHRLSFLMTSVVILGIGLVHLLWVLPVITEREDLWAQVSQQKDLVKRYQEKLGQSQNLKGELEKKEQEINRLQQSLFQGSDPYQLAATLAEPFSEGSQDLDIKSYQVMASKDYGFYQEVQLKFSFTTSIGGLHKFLENLQKRQTAILVQELDIRSLKRGKSTSLVVNVILAALMEKGSKS